MSKSTRGIRVAGIASLAVSLSVGVAAPALAAPGFEFTRIAGDDRYATAVEAAEVYGASDDVILANGQPGEYADALAGNYLAGAEDAPILLTKRSGIPSSTKAQIDDIDPDTIFVVGGTAAVPEDQVAELEADGYTVERVSGSDRFGTNAAVIAKDGASTDGIGLIATGMNFPDALAAGPFAYQGHSLGLVRTNSVPDVVGDALEADNVTKVLIFGGTGAVGQGVVDDLADRGITVEERFAGADRSETSELAAEWALENLDFTDEHVGVASGYTDGFGADALAGGPVEGNENSPMLITRNVDNPDDVLDYLEAHNDTLGDGHIYGGSAAISDAAEAAMEAAAQGTAPSGRTDRPELVSAKVLDTNTAGELGADGTTVEFTFDEEIATATTGIAPDGSGFQVYNTAGLVDGDGVVVSQDGTKVVVRFDAVNTDSAAAALTVATVQLNAVHDVSGAGSPEGDAPLGSTTGGGSTVLPAGVTEAPDLVSIGGFSDAGANSTDVAFNFDEAADVQTTAAGFHLIGTGNGVDYVGDSIVGGEGTTTVIVNFTEDLTAADIARATVDAGTVDEQADNEGDGQIDANVLQAADVSNGGNSANPDLVSVELREATTTIDQVLYTFDENVVEAGAVPASFTLYTGEATGGTIATGDAVDVNPSNPRQVLVNFAETEIDNVVGAQTLAGAITGEDGTQNQDDEVGVANTGTTSGQTAGRTGAPDLTGVTVKLRTDGFGNTQGVDATYTFDENVDTSPSAGDFFLYLANGTRLVADSCTEGGAGTAATTDDNTIVCEFNNVLDADEAIDAVLGTVDAGAVDDADTNTNPEGAEPVTKQ